MKRLLFFLMAIMFAIQGWTQGVSIFPLEEGFEGTALPPTGWTMYYNDGATAGTCSNTMSLSTTSKRTGTQSFRFSSYSGSGCLTEQYLITPELDFGGTNKLLRFYYAISTASGSDQLSIGVSTTDSAYTSFTWQTPFHPTNTSFSDNNVVEMVLGDTVKYVAIKYSGTYQYYVYVDDFTIMEVPACVKPLDLTSSNITAYTADISWTPQSSTYYFEIQYKPSSVTNWDDQSGAVITETLSDTFFTIESLNPQTAYDVRIREVCGGGDVVGTDVSEWVSLNFITPCIDLIITSNTPYIENFDNCPSGSNLSALPICWTRNTNYTTQYYPYVRTTASYSGGQSMYFYGSSTSGTHTTAVMPPIDPSIDITTLRVKFKLHYTSLSYLTGGIQVGVMTDPADWSTFVPIGSLQNIDAINTWQDREVLLSSYVPTDPSNPGRYIALSTDFGGHATYLNMDDVEISLIPNCTAVTECNVIDITSDGATVIWQGATAHNSWLVEYKADTVASWESTDVISNTVSDTFYTFTGLATNETYNVRVRAICGGGDVLGEDISDWVTRDFTTECLPYSIVTDGDFTESFDTYGTGASAFVPCWTRFNSNAVSTSNPYLNNNYSHSSPGSMYFSNSASLTLVSPVFAEDINTLQVNFWLRREGASSGTFSVGYYSDPNDLTSFVAVETFDDINTTWLEHEVVLSTVPADIKQIAFRQNQGASNWYYWLDDVTVQQIPSCSPVANLDTINVTTTSATINWASNTNQSEWFVQYKLNNIDDWGDASVVSVTVNDTTYDITGLEPSSVYNVRVRTVCGTGDVSGTDFSNWRTINIITVCGDILTLPYGNNFDSYQSGANIDAFPNCWTRNTNYSVAYYPYINTAYASSGTNALHFYGASTSGTHTTAVMPPLDSTIDITTLRVKFKLYYTSLTYLTGGIQVGVMTNPADWSTFVPVGSLQNIDATNTWQDREVLLSSYVPTDPSNPGRYIALSTDFGGHTTYLYLDDVEISLIPNCPAVTECNIVDITSEGATVSWQGATIHNSWLVEYKADTVDSWTSTDVISNTVFDTFYTITGLMANTNYNVRVRAVCGSGDVLGEDISDWVTQDFTTECTGLIITETSPYIENFDNSPSGGNLSSIPSCWKRNTNYATQYYPYINTSYASSGTQAMYFYGASTSGTHTTAILPALDASMDITTLRVKFKLYYTSTSYLTGGIQVGVMTDPRDWSTFVPVGSLQNIDAINTWQDREVPLSSYVPADPSNPGRYIALSTDFGGHTTYLYLDDVEVSPLPACPDVYGFSVGAGSNASAIVSWDTTSGSAPAEGWNIVYAETSTTPFDPSTQSAIPVMATDFPYIISGLTVGATYTFAMQSACGGNWTDTITLTIPATVTLPYTQDFEDTTNVSEWQFTTSTVNAWFIGNATGNTGNSMYISNDNGVTNSYTISTLTYAYAYAIVDFGQYAGYNFSFDWKAEGESIYDFLNVYMLPTNVEIPSGAYPSSQYEIATNLNQQSTWQHASFMLDPSEYSNQVKQLVFLWRNDGSLGTPPAVAIDNISIIGSDCGFVTDLTPLAVTSTTADITFSYSDENATQWEYSYGEASTVTDPSNGTIASITNDTFNIAGLSPNTTYNVWVRIACTLGDATWAMTTFNTMAPPATLPYSYSFEDTASNASEATAWRTVSNRPHVWTIGTASGNGTTSAGSKSVYTSADNGATRSSYTINNPSYIYYYRDFDFGSDPTTIYNVKYDYICQGYQEGTGVYDRISVYLADTTYPIPDVPTGLPVANSDSSQPMVQNLGFSYNSASWATDSLQLPAGLTGVKRLIFAHYSYYTNTGAAIDNISFGTVSCAIPTVTAENITHSSADITWESTGADSYQVLYLEWNGTTQNYVDATSSPISLTGLMPCRDYIYTIRAICGSDTTDFGPTAVFTTPSGPLPIPYTDNFDTYGTGTTILPSCWTKINTYSSDRPYITTSGYSGNCLYFYAGTAGTYNIAVMPAIDIATNPINTLHATFMYKGTYNTDKLYVGVMTDPTDASTFDTIATLNATTTWTEQDVYFASYADTGAHIAFLNGYTTTSAYGYMDNLTIDLIPSCPPPTELFTSNITTTTADVSWNVANPSSSYNVLYGQVGFDTASAGTLEVVYDTFISLYNLSASTIYDVYVQSDCGNGDISTWRKITFATACGAITTIPYTNNFDTYGTGTNIMPTCWTKINTYSGNY
ncbi:MAG: fibronectin type III domain-containing protein, partial [Bacteroidales bacterium]|nr:fibronectin type III domain-containing protein [Bacteroidales bacterium]